MHPNFIVSNGPNDGISGIREIAESEDFSLLQTNLKSVPLVTLLPKITRQSHLVINGIPNEYVEVSFTFIYLFKTWRIDIHHLLFYLHIYMIQSLSEVKELQGFSAIIYSSFDEEIQQ